MFQSAVQTLVPGREPPPFDGRYLVRREIGRGGICAVHEATHRFTGRRVALKRLLPEMASHPEAAARLHREGHALGTVSHPGVVQVLDAGTVLGAPYLVMELLEGARSLEGLLASRGPLPVADAIALVRQASSAVASVHEAGVVHRDLKPGNLLVTRPSRPEDPGGGGLVVKVIDFGLAAVTRGHVYLPRITRAETIHGTAEYLSLERLTATDDHRPPADVWALGVTLFECVTGAVPFPGGFADVLQAVATRDAPRLDRVAGDVPAAIADVVERALARDPADRYPDAGALRVALDEASAASDVDLPASAWGPPPGAAARMHARAPYVTPVRLAFEGCTFDARIEDVSERGLLVMSPVVVPEGAIGAAQFAMPMSGQLTAARVVVRWSRPGEHPDGPRSIVGLERLDEDPRATAEIAAYVGRVAGRGP